MYNLSYKTFFYIFGLCGIGLIIYFEYYSVVLPEKTFGLMANLLIRKRYERYLAILYCTWAALNEVLWICITFCAHVASNGCLKTYRPTMLGTVSFSLGCYLGT